MVSDGIKNYVRMARFMQKPLRCKLRSCNPNVMKGTRRIAVDVPQNKIKIIDEIELACPICDRRVKKYLWEHDDNG